MNEETRTEINYLREMTQKQAADIESLQDKLARTEATLEQKEDELIIAEKNLTDLYGQIKAIQSRHYVRGEE